VTATIETGIVSSRAHRAYLDGLGGNFDPGKFLRASASSAGTRLAASTT